MSLVLDLVLGYKFALGLVDVLFTTVLGYRNYYKSVLCIMFVAKILFTGVRSNVSSQIFLVDDTW